MDGQKIRRMKQGLTEVGPGSIILEGEGHITYVMYCSGSLCIHGTLADATGTR